MNKDSLIRAYMGTATVFGLAVVVLSVVSLPGERFDWRFVVLSLGTVCIGSRISIWIPRCSSRISVSDTLVFLTVLIYGGEAATIVAACEAAVASLRFSKRTSTVLFNSGISGLSTFLSSTILRLLLGDVPSLATSGQVSRLITGLCVLALVQYVANSGLVAIAAALKNDKPVWITWQENYLWTSLTYLAGAFGAGVTARLFGTLGINALLVAVPIIAIVYVTYQTYLRNLENSAAQAAQAERHIEELSHYISEQERIREQFTQIEKLSALGELASGVAHDFNNTLAGILGRAQLLLRTSDPERIRKGLEIIIKTAEDGAKTVKRIQDFARQRRDHDFRPVLISQILTDVSEITRPRWKDRSEAQDVHIVMDLKIKSDAFVLGDDSELREVLVNMVFNAVDAMPEGGRLTLEAADEDDRVVISVSDTGLGMDPEVRSRIFDPFFTTKGEAGLGLGLAVSFGIVRRHEGTIEVESEPGRGAVFRIALPVLKRKPSMIQPGEFLVTDTQPSGGQVSPTIAANGPTPLEVLVVDDETNVRELLRDILEGAGCNVTVAENGHAALEKFQSAFFDAVCTDIGMPGMSGWELAGAIRERNVTIPLAVITGWGDAVGVDKQKQSQVDWVITKPFSTERIEEMVKEIQARRRSEEKRAQIVYAA